MQTNILSQAIKLYKKGSYEKALELFGHAGAVYGAKTVEFNVLLCKKALKQTIAKSTDRPSSAPQKIFPLDPATRYMLSNKGQLILTEEQRKQCIEEHKKLSSRKSTKANIRNVNYSSLRNLNDLPLPPLPQSTNDFLWKISRNRLKSNRSIEPLPGLSVIVPTFNRSTILEVTLACLINQKTQYPFEVIIADDGSRESIDTVVRKYESQLDLKYVRQKDYGYQLCAVRNLGIRTSKYGYIALLDCDMAPNSKWVQSYMELLLQDDDIALVGPRKYVDTSSHAPQAFLSNSDFIDTLPEVLSTDTVGRSRAGTISVDWRLSHFRKTADLRLCDTPFRYFSGGNVAFARKWIDRIGYFDEEFTHWGGEDVEFGYRLYRAGCFFRLVWGGMAYHQEPIGTENETNRADGKTITDTILLEKVPYVYRTIKPLPNAVIHKIPLVSIYIPAYNCADNLVRCVNSALNQTVTDLEVCICNDGSTDNTLDVLVQHFGSNPRVRIHSQVNGGIGFASNKAVSMARGYYIGQLDSDDYLEPDAVELCLKEFFSNRKLACVYTTYQNVNSNGTLLSKGYNWPEYSREKLCRTMIVHHFRMFTVRAWYMTEGFDESIENAVDYDMFLKLSSIGPFKHVNTISYNRVLHGTNTSTLKREQQIINTAYALRKHLERSVLERDSAAL
jgi:chondroitin synthase